MLARYPTLAFGTLLVLTAGHGIRADNHFDHLEVSIEVTVNPAAGAPRMTCAASAPAGREKQAWWVTFAQAETQPEETWKAVSRRVGCGAGRFENGSSDTGAAAGFPYLIAEVSTFAGLNPAMLTPERVLGLDIALSLRKLSGVGTQGEIVYQALEEKKRNFYFLEDGEAFLPLLVADEAEQEALGIREVLLRVTAGRISEGSAASYGVVRVTSGTEKGELLLDGGVVGEISPGSETVLRNVSTGMRTLGVRATSGRQIRKSVRVEADRTVVVDLSAPNPARTAAFYRLEALGQNQQGYLEYRRGSDAAVVVKIPAGEFLMGNKETEGTPLEHKVYASEFLIDKMGVTWGQYKKYAEATGIPLPPRDPYWGIHHDHPVVFVTWEEAKGYCEWAGGRLPTEAEREKAARGTDRRKYPWGNEEPAPNLGVFRSSWGFEATSPVGTHPAGASPYGVLDMGGNVWEWCSDWWGRDYFEVSPYRDPRGPASGTAHVVKGGSWDSRPSVLSSSSRNFGYRGYRELDFGFRCAMNAPNDPPKPD